MNVIVFASRKGGSGKSTLAAHLAAHVVSYASFAIHLGEFSRVREKCRSAREIKLRPRLGLR